METTGITVMRRLSTHVNILYFNSGGDWRHGARLALIPGDKRRILNNDKPVAPHAGNPDMRDPKAMKIGPDTRFARWSPLADLREYTFVFRRVKHMNLNNVRVPHGDTVVPIYRRKP